MNLKTYSLFVTVLILGVGVIVGYSWVILQLAEAYGMWVIVTGLLLMILAIPLPILAIPLPILATDRRR